MMIAGTLLHSLSCKQTLRECLSCSLAHEYLVFLLSLSHENEWYQVRLIAPSDHGTTEFVPRSSSHMVSDQDLLRELSIFPVGFLIC